MFQFSAIQTRCTEQSAGELAEIFATEFRWSVFPCYAAKQGKCCCSAGEDCGNPGKHPRKRLGGRKGGGLLAASHCRNTIDEWWEKWPTANVAVRTGNGFIVIDIDPRHGGFESLAALEASLGKLPRSFV